MRAASLPPLYAIKVERGDAKRIDHAFLSIVVDPEKADAIELFFAG